MHEDVLPKHSLELLNQLSGYPSFQDPRWILAGGTGLAFHLGHRVSEDLDFFRPEPMDLPCFHDALERIGDYEILHETSPHTLTVLICGTKLSFFCVPDPFLFEPIPHRFFSVADPRDIALMKLAAIAGRGSRKDFADLFMILQNPPTLKEYFNLLPRKHDPRRLDIYHILKSLCWFEDAEQEPDLTMRTPFDWNECKTFFLREAQTVALYS